MLCRSVRALFVLQVVLAVACTSGTTSSSNPPGGAGSGAGGGTGGAAGTETPPGMGGTGGKPDQGGGGVAWKSPWDDAPGGEEFDCSSLPDGRTESNPDSLLGDPCYTLSLPEDQRWILEPSRWKLLDFGVRLPSKPCYVYEGDLQTFRPEPLKWESCGPACERANPWQGLGKEGYTHGGELYTVRTENGGRALISTTHVWEFPLDGWVTPERHLMLHYRRFLDGTKGGQLFLMDSPMENRIRICAPYSNQAEFRISLGRTSDDEDVWITGVWRPEGVIWQLPPSTVDRYEICHRAFMEEGGRKFYFCGHYVHGILTPGSSEMTLLQLDHNWALRGAGEWDLVVWPEGWDYAHFDRVDIKGWAPDGKGVRLLHYAFDGATCALALSDTHMAGLAIDREYHSGCDNYQPNPRFWVSPRSYGGGVPNPVHRPIPLEGRVWPHGIKTWGNFVAVALVYDSYERPDETVSGWVALIRMDDWAMRWIPIEKGLSGFEFTLDRSYLYTMPAISSDTGYFANLYVHRYDLMRFDEIGLPNPH